MGFLNKILKGLGFEDEEEEIVKEPKNIKKKENKKQTKMAASFNLNEIEEENAVIEQPKEETTPVIEDSGFSIEMFKLKSQQDVQNLIEKLKQGIKVIANAEQLSSQDLTRSLDFLTGAVFALDLKMQKLDDKIFIIQ